MESKIVYDKSVDYSQKASSSSYYKLLRVQQQTGGPKVAVSANSSVEAVWDIPTTVFNLSKSFLRFSVYFPAGAAGIYNNFNTAVPPVRRLSLFTRAGRYLCDIQNFQHHWAMSKYFSKPTQEFIASPGVGAEATLANARLEGTCLFHNPNSTEDAPAALNNHGRRITHSVANPPVPSLEATNGRRLIQSSQLYVTSAAAAAMYVNCEIQLGMIPFSIFSADRNLFSSEALQLRVEFAPHSDWAFQRDTAIDTLETVAACAVAVEVNDCYLYMATEQNEAIRRSVIDKVTSEGLNMLIPYPTLYRINVGTNTSGSVQQKVNLAHGRRLLRVLSLESTTVDTLATKCNYYNRNGLKTESYNTNLNSVRLQDEALEMKGNQIGYVFNKRFLKDSPLEPVGEYLSTAPIHCDDWSMAGQQGLIHCADNDLIAQGLDLSIEQTWSRDILTKSAVDTTVNILIVGQKELRVTPVSVDVM